ncbi:mitogen-activated protein kinase 3 [Tanacetum coccineum]
MNLNSSSNLHSYSNCQNIRQLNGMPHSDDSDIKDSNKNDASRKKKSCSSNIVKWKQQVNVGLEIGLEVPPNDGHMWRKYGQKEILNAKYPNVCFLQLLGTPTKADLCFIKNEDAMRYLSQLPRHPRKSLLKTFPHVNPSTSDLVEKMLTFDPAKRITVEEALAHPYLERLHDDDDEPICPNPFCLDFEQQVAATLILRWAVAMNKCNVIHSMCKVQGNGILLKDLSPPLDNPRQ